MYDISDRFLQTSILPPIVALRVTDSKAKGLMSSASLAPQFKQRRNTQNVQKGLRYLISSADTRMRIERVMDVIVNRRVSCACAGIGRWQKRIILVSVSAN